MRIVHFDTETTGLHSINNKIVEIAIIVTEGDNFDVVQQFHSYVNPQMPVGKSALIHGLDDKFLRDKPKFSDIANEVKSIIQDNGGFICAHNLPFDLSFLLKEFAEAKVIPPVIKRSIDTLSIAKIMKIEGPKRLFALYEKCKNKRDDLSAHNALDDTKVLIEVHKMLREMNKEGEYDYSFDY